MPARCAENRWHWLQARWLGLPGFPLQSPSSTSVASLRHNAATLADVISEVASQSIGLSTRKSTVPARSMCVQSKSMVAQDLMGIEIMGIETNRETEQAIQKSTNAHVNKMTTTAHKRTHTDGRSHVCTRMMHVRLFDHENSILYLCLVASTFRSASLGLARVLKVRDQ